MVRIKAGAIRLHQLFQSSFCLQLFYAISRIESIPGVCAYWRKDRFPAFIMTKFEMPLRIIALDATLYDESHSDATIL